MRKDMPDFQSDEAQKKIASNKYFCQACFDGGFRIPEKYVRKATGEERQWNKARGSGLIDKPWHGAKGGTGPYGKVFFYEAKKDTPAAFVSYDGALGTLDATRALPADWFEQRGEQRYLKLRWVPNANRFGIAEASQQPDGTFGAASSPAFPIIANAIPNALLTEPLGLSSSAAAP